MNAPTKIEADPVIRLQMALAEALPKLEAAKKNSANPAFKSKYADLGSVIEAIRPIADCGIWYRQVLHEGSEGVTVETLYIGFGATISAGTLFMPADRKNAQGYGSALSYARRYGLQTAFGLATEDDDGNAASAPAKAAKPATISDADWAHLVQLVEATGTDVGKLCQAYKVDSLKAFSPEQFTNAKEILEKRLSEKQKEQADA